MRRSQRALTLYTRHRLRCCDRYIQCQRSLAVKPLTSRPVMQTVRPIGRPSANRAGQPASAVALATTVGSGRGWLGAVVARQAAGQRAVRVDCGLSYTTVQATIVRSAIVACLYKFRTKSVDSARAVCTGWTARPVLAACQTSRRHSRRPLDSPIRRKTDWPAASPRDAAAVTSREPQSREARVWLVIFIFVSNVQNNYASSVVA